MKTFTYKLKAAGVTVTLLFTMLTSFGQPAPDYTFTTNALIVGVDKTVGAQYRFTNVATGVDALVTITAMVNASLDALDATGAGYVPAFQPQVRVVKLTTGYVDFDIQFVIAGTSTPMVQPVINVTALDIDGYNSLPTQKLYEFEQFDMGAGAKGKYEFTTSDINVAFNGTAIKGINVAGVDYGSINLSQNVRFTAYKSSVSLLKVRSGAVNGDSFNPDVVRQRSFYFAMFSYTNAIILDLQDLASFKGAIVQNNIASLQWTLAKNHSIKKIDIEKATPSGSFQTIKTVVYPQEQTFAYSDYNTVDGNNAYRLKLYDATGKQEYSNVVTVKATATAKKQMSVYPTVSTTATTLSFNGQQAGIAMVEVKDYSGRLYITKSVPFNKGANTMHIDLTSLHMNGPYLVKLITGGDTYTGKIIKITR